MGEDERKEVAESPVEDLELEDAKADEVRGGNITQNAQETKKAIINNLRG